jgi:hypothetical protein
LSEKQNEVQGLFAMLSSRASWVTYTVLLGAASWILFGVGTTAGSTRQEEKGIHSVGALPKAATRQIKRSGLEHPCAKGVDNRDSELCAQWKAADAAKDAADWTQRGFWIGIVGFLGLLTTLYYTRQAVKVASEATNDARKALEIAERTADRQLSPYVYVERIEALDFSAESLVVNIKIKNFGQTPAQNFKTRFNYGWCEAGKIVAFKPDLSVHDLKADIPPGHSQRTISPIDPPDNHIGDWNWREFEPLVTNGTMILVVCVSFEFTYFGRLERRDTVVIFDGSKPRHPLPLDNLTFDGMRH